jgi:hypothetical protein
MIEAIFDKDLAKIVSYLTFDGHLAEDLKCFYLSSKDMAMLSDFDDLIHKKFQIKGRLEKGTGFGESYKYRVFSREVCRFLERAGTPKGCKINKIFLIPEWIKNNQEAYYNYLKAAFECEGGFWLESKKYPIVRFGLNKNEGLAVNGEEFLIEMKRLLLNLDIKTSNVWVAKGNIRSDGIVTKSFRFTIRQPSIERFLDMFGFTNRFKKETLITYYREIRLSPRGTILAQH